MEGREFGSNPNNPFKTINKEELMTTYKHHTLLFITLIIVNFAHYIWRKRTHNTNIIFPARVAIWFVNAMVIVGSLTTINNNRIVQNHTDIINTSIYPDKTVSVIQTRETAPFLYDDVHSKNVHYYIIEHNDSQKVEKLRLERTNANKSEYTYEIKVMQTIN